jgi:hypothetical protein
LTPGQPQCADEVRHHVTQYRLLIVPQITFNRFARADDTPVNGSLREATMTTNQQGTTSPFDVHLLIEREGEKFKIQSNKLQEIGQQLRGKSRFSVFNSIILPLMVTLATTLLTSFLQYVSWWNAVSVKAATEVAENATKAYVSAADAAARRIQVTDAFIPVIIKLAQPPQFEPQMRRTDGRASPGTTLQTAILEQSPSALHDLEHELSKTRFKAYHEQLRSWDDNYEKLLADIGRHLDQPIFDHASRKPVRVRRHVESIKNVVCTRTLTEAINQLPEFGEQRADSLRLQFAVLRQCFGRLQARIEDHKKASIQERRVAFDQKTVEQIDRELEQLQEWNNQFSCYARSRIRYYESKKITAIVNPMSFISHWLETLKKSHWSGDQKKLQRLEAQQKSPWLEARKKDAEEHLKLAHERCNTATRPT